MNRGPGGFAVLIILWMLALLALIADRMIVVGRSEIRIADNLRTAAIAEAAADGAIFEGIYRLGVNGPGGWKIDGRDRHVFVGREDVTVRLEDDGMKINPNLAPAPLLQAILQQVGMPAAEARVAAGWIVAARTRAPGSATLGGKFRTLAQLAAVPGISQDIAARLVPHLTLNDPGGKKPGALDPWVDAALREAPPPPPPKRPPLAGQNKPPASRAVTIRALVGPPDAPLFERDATVRLSGNQSYRILFWGTGGEI